MAPLDAAARFAQAVRDQDESAAMAASTKEGWTGPGDSARALYQKAIQGNVELIPGDKPHISGDRAVVGVAARREGKDQHVLWLLMEGPLGNWRIGGHSDFEAIAGKFLEGAIPARMDWGALPESEEARAWGEAFLGYLESGEIPDDLPTATQKLLPRFKPLLRPGSEGSVSRTLDLSALGRLAVGLSFKRPTHEEPRVIVLGREGDHWIPVFSSRNPQVGGLLYGLTWKGARAASPAAGITQKQQDAQRKTQAAIQKILRQAGIPVDAEGKPDTSQISAEEMERRAPELAMAAAKEVLQSTRDTPLTLEGLPEPVRKGLTDYLAQNTEGEQARLDPDFLREHGPAMIQSVLAQLGQQLTSQKLAVDVGEGDEKRQVELSLGDLFKALVKPKATPEDGASSGTES